MASLQAIPRGFDKGSGGIKYVLLGKYEEMKVTLDASANATFKAYDGSTALANTVFKRFDITKETSNWVETATGSGTAGTVGYSQVLTLVFARNEALFRNQLQVIGKSEVIAVVVDRNGQAVVLGADNGMDLTSGVMQTGSTITDTNGMTLTLTASEPFPHGIVTDAILATLQA